jgi:hypothetical protein
MSYLNEAEVLFARKTYALFNTLTITTVVGQSLYTLPAGVLLVSSGLVSGQARELSNMTRRNMPPDTATNTGIPLAFATDEVSGAIRFYPVPDAIMTITMRAAQLPATSFTAATAPSIPVQYHPDLIEYAAYRALRVNDVDGSNTTTSALFKREWEERLNTAVQEFYRIRLGNDPTAARSWTGIRR